MITINLLPQEYRKKERTPLVMLLPMFAGVACVFSAFAVAAYVHFVWRAEIENEKTAREQALSQRQPRLTYEKRLLAEEAEYKKRGDTITGIAEGRILWTKILDQFTDVTVAGEELPEDGYLIWLKELKTSPPKRASVRPGQKAAKSGGQITVKGYAVADRDALQTYNAWHAAMTNSVLYDVAFNSMSKPTGSIEQFNDEKLPNRGWTIDVTVDMKDPADARKREAELEKEFAEKEGK